MASICTRILQRSSILALKTPIPKSTSSSSLTRSPTPSFASPSISPKSITSPINRFSLSRSSPEFGSVASMLPLHSAVAESFMTCASACHLGIAGPVLRSWGYQFQGD